MKLARKLILPLVLCVFAVLGADTFLGALFANLSYCRTGFLAFPAGLRHLG